MRHERFEGDDALDQLSGPHRMTIFAAVVFAGAVGVALRYLLDAGITRHLGDNFPWSTFIINIVGAFALGFVVTVLTNHAGEWEVVRPALSIGLLGGFTTFSALAVEAVDLMDDGRMGRAVVYVVGTNSLGIAAAIVGIAVARTASTW